MSVVEFWAMHLSQCQPLEPPPLGLKLPLGLKPALGTKPAARAKSLFIFAAAITSARAAQKDFIRQDENK